MELCANECLDIWEAFGFPMDTLYQGTRQAGRTPADGAE